MITGTPSDDPASRAETNAPKPAMAAWPSVIWPLKPVTHTIDVNVTASPTVICAYGRVMLLTTNGTAIAASANATGRPTERRCRRPPPMARETRPPVLLAAMPISSRWRKMSSATMRITAERFGLSELSPSATHPPKW